MTARSAYVPLSFAWGEAFQFDWSDEGAVIGGVWRKVQLAHMKLCASRAFWLAAYPTGNESYRFRHSSHTAKARIKSREQARRTTQEALADTP